MVIEALPCPQTVVLGMDKQPRAARVWREGREEAEKEQKSAQNENDDRWGATSVRYMKAQRTTTDPRLAESAFRPERGGQALRSSSAADNLTPLPSHTADLLGASGAFGRFPGKTRVAKGLPAACYGHNALGPRRPVPTGTHPSSNPSGPSSISHHRHSCQCPDGTVRPSHGPGLALHPRCSSSASALHTSFARTPVGRPPCGQLCGCPPWSRPPCLSTLLVHPALPCQKGWAVVHSLSHVPLTGSSCVHDE